MEKIKVIEFKKFDGVANKTSFTEIKNILFKCERIDLVPNEMIVKLNIRWGELYCICTQEEWQELLKILNDNGIKIRKTSPHYLILDILNFFFVQPIELIVNFLKRKKGR